MVSTSDITRITNGDKGVYDATKQLLNGACLGTLWWLMTGIIALTSLWVAQGLVRLDKVPQARCGVWIIRMTIGVMF